MIRTLAKLVAVGMCFFSFHSLAQITKPLTKLTQERFQQSPSLPEARRPFTLNVQSGILQSNVFNALSDKTIFTLDQAKSAELLAGGDELLRLFIPVDDSEMELQLVRYQVAADGFQVVTDQSGSQSIPYTPGIHYRGIVKGDPNSTAAISIYENEITGVVSTDQGNFNLGKVAGFDNLYVFYNEKDNSELEPFTCGVQDEEYIVTEADLAGGEKAAVKCVKVYLETDYELFQNKGSAANVTNYMLALFNQVATLYMNEGITTQVSEVYVWTTDDPYSGSASNRLSSFRTTRTSFNGDIAHLVNLNGNLGGVAYVDVLCNNSYRYAFSCIAPTYSNVPTYSWAVEVMTHEMGHNLGSPHTHSCTWPGGAIDNCYTTEGGCAAGPAPTNGGTIMSYCHLTSYGINFNNGFGSQPGNLIRNRVTAAACLGTCETTPVECNAPTNVAASAVTATGFTLSWTAAPSATSYSVRYKPASLSTWTTTTASGTTITLSGLTQNTTYNYSVATNCGVGNVSAYTADGSVTTPVAPVTYCVSKGNSVADEWIQSVVVGSFSKVSGSNGGYADFTSNVVTLEKGKSVNFTLTPGFSGSSYAEYWKIWIDYNKNGSFEDAGELVYNAGSASSAVRTGSFTVPAGAVTQQTRMRVSMKYNAAQTSCESFSYGEVEDYTANIIDAVPVSCNAPSAPTASGIAHNSMVVSWTAVSGASSYELQYKTAAASVWTTVTTTAASYSLSGLAASTTYQFQVRTVCGASFSAYSAQGSATTSAAPVNPVYCTSRGNSTAGEWIKTIAVGSINNTSNANGGYRDYTNLSTSLGAGASATITLTPGFPTGGLFGFPVTQPEYWRIWVDLNRDGDFDDANELRLSSTTSSTGTVSGTLSIPTGTGAGSTRMRIAMKRSSVAGPCETFANGEVEDYTLVITSPLIGALPSEEAGDFSPTLTDIRLFPNPAKADTKLEFSMASGTGGVQMVLRDMLGRQLTVYSWSDVEIDTRISHRIQTDGLQTGVYLIELTTKKGVSHIERLVVE